MKEVQVVFYVLLVHYMLIEFMFSSFGHTIPLRVLADVMPNDVNYINYWLIFHNVYSNISVCDNTNIKLYTP